MLVNGENLYHKLAKGCAYVSSPGNSMCGQHSSVIATHLKQCCLQCKSLVGMQAFDFDRVFGPEVQQAGIFQDVSQLVTSALDGYNVCIFAYGQTGMIAAPLSHGTPLYALFRGMHATTHHYALQHWIAMCV